MRGSGWPFPKETLLPYYGRAATLEGVGDSLPDAAVSQALRLSEPDFGAAEMYFSRWCPQPNFARLHRRTLEEKPGVQVWLHANVVELLLEGERAQAVRCRTLDGREAVFTADEFVFCLGGIESCRFFLQPRAGGLPWNSSGLLGMHFQDHVDCSAAVLEPVSRRRFHARFDNIFLRGLKYQPKLRLKAAETAAAEMLQVSATMMPVSPADESLAAMKGIVKDLKRGEHRVTSLRAFWKQRGDLPLLARSAWRYAVDHRAYVPDDSRLELRVHCEQEPESSSRLTLTGERDRLGLWRTRLDWRISAMELRSVRRFVEVASRELAGLARVVAQPLLFDDAALLSQCDDSNHHMGGMRMDPSPGRGVVTPELRLHGTRNVFVCSAAVFPTSGSSNPTHTLLALAVRLADHLAGPGRR